MTLVQSTPTEIRQLDLNAFRLTLRDLEDDPDGRPWPQTHTHNTTVVVGGVELARVVNILEPYTVTFEDGQYAVNLVGANSNLADRVNVNQVSVRSGNSAGLVTSQAIEFSEYAQGVWVDVTSGNSGAIYPTGTLRKPVDNVSDAVQIASFYGLATINIIGNLTLDTGDDVSGFKLIGQNATRSVLTMNAGATINNVDIFECTVSGTLDGNAIIRNCYVTNLTYFSGFIYNCQLGGTIILGNNAQANILQCYSADTGTNWPIIDFGGSGQSLFMGPYTGNCVIKNKTGTETSTISLDGGQIAIDLTTVTHGTLYAVGTGKVVDEADRNDHLPHGAYGQFVLQNETTYGRMLQEIWTLYGLDPDEPLTINEDGSISVGSITIDANTTGVTPNRITTQTRTS